MTIGNRIKDLRSRLGISIDELADKLGKNRTTVYRYENGDIENLPLGILDPLADALGTTPSYLMGWDSVEESAKKISDKTYIRHVERWHREFGSRAFTDDEHEKLIEYGHFLISLREK